jgi:outer membrane immunogenic protein
MKKLVVALSALAAFTGSALAADMAPRPYSKAPPPPPAPVANWTGCYIGGGGGYGMWNQENTGYIDPPGVAVRRQSTDTFTNGGRGYFGTIQGGCDYQFGGNWVVGAFADYDFADINGRRNDILFNGIGTEKLSSQWAVGARAGYLITPSLLTYVVGGYTEAKFDRTNFTAAFGPPFGIPTTMYLEGATHKGWFIGAGDEYALSFLPGLFWKTEYRVSTFDRQTQRILTTQVGAVVNESYDTRKWEQTVRSELVYRFNWGGPVVAKY